MVKAQNMVWVKNRYGGIGIFGASLRIKAKKCGQLPLIDNK